GLYASLTLTYPEIHLRSSARKASVKACVLASDSSSSRTIGSFHRSGARVLCGRVHASSRDDVRIDSTRGTRSFNSTSFTKPSSTEKPLRTKVSKRCSHRLAGDQLLLIMDEPCGHWIFPSPPSVCRFFPITRTSFPRRPAYLIAMPSSVYSSSW